MTQEQTREEILASVPAVVLYKDIVGDTWNEVTDRLGEPREKLRSEYRRWKEENSGVIEAARKDLGDNVLLQNLRLASASPLKEALSEGVLSPLAVEVLSYLMGRKRKDTWQSVMAMSTVFDRSADSVKEALQELQEVGYNVQVDDDVEFASVPKTQPPSFNRIPIVQWLQAGNVYRFGVLSDTHLCNRNQRLDALNALYDLYEAEGITRVLHAGNMIDGEFKFNRHELLAWGLEGQCAYVTRHYPRRPGITTHFISGDCHEGWYGKDGLDVGRTMHARFQAQGRDDLQWLGHVEADLSLSDKNRRSVLRLAHPGGGSAYAVSYSVQKIVESYQGGEKPSILIVGHYHKYNAGYVREVFALQPGCVEDQTTFMRKKKLQAHVGGCILEVHMTSDGHVGRVKHEFIPFYDKGFYQNYDYGSIYGIDNGHADPRGKADLMEEARI